MRRALLLSCVALVAATVHVTAFSTRALRSFSGVTRPAQLLGREPRLQRSALAGSDVRAAGDDSSAPPRPTPRARRAAFKRRLAPLAAPLLFLRPSLARASTAASLAREIAMEKAMEDAAELAVEEAARAAPLAAVNGGPPLALTVSGPSSFASWGGGARLLLMSARLTCNVVRVCA